MCVRVLRARSRNLDLKGAFVITYFTPPHLTSLSDLDFRLYRLPSRGTTVFFPSCACHFLTEYQDPVMEQLKMRCKILEIDNRAATFRCDENRNELLMPEPEPGA